MAKVWLRVDKAAERDKLVSALFNSGYALGMRVQHSLDIHGNSEESYYVIVSDDGNELIVIE